MIGQRIAAARSRKGLPQRETSVAFGWPPGVLSEVERGTRPLAASALVEIARFLGADAGYLLTGKAGSHVLSPREQRHIQNCRRLAPARFDALERIVDCPEARTC
ncbi:helix-turn-helix domain-containing protein [Methylorubrum rhodinum]|uniref:helix-turn-helix domain-containing protein n=1 Tax=Methylorubrum rhodinum TaxID=29428 RepID=UPI00161690F5|nr:helix-turn-helix transcriptional regulator [Methylorubrum rhodinum]